MVAKFRFPVKHVPIVSDSQQVRVIFPVVKIIPVPSPFETKKSVFSARKVTQKNHVLRSWGFDMWFPKIFPHVSNDGKPLSTCARLESSNQVTAMGVGASAKAKTPQVRFRWAPSAPWRCWNVACPHFLHKMGIFDLQVIDKWSWYIFLSIIVGLMFNGLESCVSAVSKSQLHHIFMHTCMSMYMLSM